MIDLHCHLLPAIDDGPPDLDGTLALAAALVADGVTAVTATPHVRLDHRAVVPGELSARCDAVREQLREAGIPLAVLPGAEVDLINALQLSPEALRLVSCAQRGHYLLVETPYGPLTSRFEDFLFRATAERGLRALLAHPERNPTFQSDPSRLAALVDRGVLLQVTAPSLAARRRSSRSRRLALELIERGLAHVLSSDAHRAAGSRRPMLTEAVRVAARISRARAEWMVTEAPAAILAGEPLPASPPVSARTRLPFGRRQSP